VLISISSVATAKNVRKVALRDLEGNKTRVSDFQGAHRHPELLGNLVCALQRRNSPVGGISSTVFPTECFFCPPFHR
jgi:hypothetical protein